MSITRINGAPRLRRALRNPELNLVFFSFLLNFVWELWQVPYYQGMATTPHYEAIRVCTQASFGDGIISVIAFWIAAVADGGRSWYLRIRAFPFAAYLAGGLLITILMEWLATGPLDRWQYGPKMPRLPLLGIGLLPLLQWLVLPPIILALMRRQTRGTAPTSARANSDEP